MWSDCVASRLLCTATFSTGVTRGDTSLLQWSLPPPVTPPPPHPAPPPSPVQAARWNSAPQHCQVQHYKHSSHGRRSKEVLFSGAQWKDQREGSWAGVAFWNAPLCHCLWIGMLVCLFVFRKAKKVVVSIDFIKASLHSKFLLETSRPWFVLKWNVCKCHVSKLFINWKNKLLIGCLSLPAK